MTLRVDVGHKTPNFTLNVAFESQRGLTAIFGASGSGKTTLINIIAGLLKPDRALITLGTRTLADTGQGIWLPPWKRNIGYVFQDARLFPHLSVKSNLNYGQPFSRPDLPHAEQARIVELLGIAHLLSRMPAQLSGGEKQRIAIGRALFSAPDLLLMDEPLASLDQPRKEEILPYIESLRDNYGLPIVYVSHALAEVMRLANEVVVLSEGRMTGFGNPASIISNSQLLPPAESGEGGMLLDMTMAGYDPDVDISTLSSPAGLAQVTGKAGERGASVRVRFRARDVMIATSRPKQISALNIFEGTIVTLIEVDRSSVEVRLDCKGIPLLARLTRHSARLLKLKTGLKAYAIVKAVSVVPGGQSLPL